MIRNDARELVFEKLLNCERSRVINWLKQKYSCFPITECEDIFQEGSLELWKKFKTALDLGDKDFCGMLFAICRNLSTHHLQKIPVKVEWNDCYYPQETQVETDYGYISPGVAHKMLKERVYDEISRLSTKDQQVIQGYIIGKRMSEIARENKFKSEQSAKNRKSKIVARLRNAINGQASQDARPSFFYPRQVTFLILLVFIIAAWHECLIKKCYDYE